MSKGSSNKGSKRSGSERQPEREAATLLGELEKAHHRLSDAIGELELLARGDAPDASVLANVRWRLSAASVNRRLLWARILGYLSPKAEGKSGTDLRQLQDIDIELVRASSAHVGTWTTDAILEDWPGYCAASEAMRRKMSDAMEVERRILVPLLQPGRVAGE